MAIAIKTGDQFRSKEQTGLLVSVIKQLMVSMAEMIARIMMKATMLPME